MDEKTFLSHIADILKNTDYDNLLSNIEDEDISINKDFIDKIKRLLYLYSKIKRIYNDDILLTKFMELIQTYILIKRDEQFPQLARKEVFIEFFKLYISLKDILINNSLDNRHTKISFINRDISSVIRKYDWYFRGILEFNLKSLRGITFMVVLSNERIITGSSTGELIIWNIKLKEIEKVLKGHTKYITLAKILPNGKFLTSSYDRTHRIWNLETGQTEKILAGGDAFSTALIFPDGKLMTSSLDYTIRTWNLETGVDEGLISVSNLPPDYFILDNGRIINLCPNGTIRIWDLQTGKTEKILPGSPLIVFFNVRSDGRIICGSNNYILSIWNLETGQMEKILKGYTGDVTCIADIDEERIITGSNDRTLRIWNTLTEETEKILEGHLGPIKSVGVLPDGRIVSVSDKTIKIWK